MAEIKIDNDECDGCGTCRDSCPVDVFQIVDGKSVVANVDECLFCRACEVQCSKGCIQISD